MVDPVCIGDVSEGSYNGTECESCPVIIEDTVRFAPPVICYEEIVVATVYTIIDTVARGTRLSTEFNSRSTKTYANGEIVLDNVDTPQTPVIAVSITGLRSSTPCYVLIDTYTASGFADSAR